MRVSRESLLRNLESVQPGLSPREIVEQSNCFIFQGGRVLTYNDEVSCSCDSALEESFTGVVQATPLLSLLRKMPDDDVEVEQTEKELLVVGRGRKRKAGLPMVREVTLPVSVVEKPAGWAPLHPDFCQAVSLVRQCAGEDESRFSLTCVHIDKKWVEACDNYQLCRWGLETGVKKGVLVRQSSVKEITALGMTEFSETESWMHFRNGLGLTLSCRRYLEDFPDLTEILKVTGSPATLPKGLSEAAEVASVFSEESAEKLLLIELRRGRLVVEGRGVTGWYRERRKVKYAGDPLSFMISPQLLTDLVKRHSECVISPQRLKVDLGTYQYVTCLSDPDSVRGRAEEETTGGGADEE